MPAKWEVKVDHALEEHEHAVPEGLTQSPGRKLCVRHQRMADEGTNLKLQQVCTLLSFYPHYRLRPHASPALLLGTSQTIC